MPNAMRLVYDGKNFYGYPFKYLRQLKDLTLKNPNYQLKDHLKLLGISINKDKSNSSKGVGYCFVIVLTKTQDKYYFDLRILEAECGHPGLLFHVEKDVTTNSSKCMVVAGELWIRLYEETQSNEIALLNNKSGRYAEQLIAKGIDPRPVLKTILGNHYTDEKFFYASFSNTFINHILLKKGFTTDDIYRSSNKMQTQVQDQTLIEQLLQLLRTQTTTLLFIE